MRSRAWRSGDTGLLRHVYTPDADQLVRDQWMLRRYVERGLRVSGVHLHLGSVRVVATAPTAVHLLVTDRLAAATAIDRRGNRHRLPDDLPSRHTIVLRLVTGSWRIARVSQL